VIQLLQNPRGKGIRFQLSGPIHSVGTPTGRYIIYSVIICWAISMLIGIITSVEIGLGAGIGLLLALMAVKGKIIGRVEAKRRKSLEDLIKR